MRHADPVTAGLLDQIRCAEGATYSVRWLTPSRIAGWVSGLPMISVAKCSARMARGKGRKAV